MYKKLLQISIILALIVVILGAYTRLGDAGLGCPDWPGCYGQFIVPDAEDGTKIDGYDRPLEVAKGWKEMVHRYAASSLGLSIIVIFFLVLAGKPKNYQSLALPSFTLFFVILQGAFGMWTVTLLVHPVIVTTHLLGGFITTVLLVWLLLNQARRISSYRNVLSRHRVVLLTALFLLIVQIILGGWTSSNYAALSCGEQFPKCLGSWWPAMDFTRAAYLGPLGVDYEFGVLENSARAAIQTMHRIGALVTTAMIALLIYLYKDYVHLKVSLLTMAGLLIMQIALGVLNVLFSIPMLIAVLHNAVALMLLLSLVGLVHKVYKSSD